MHRDMVEQLPLDALNERKIDVFECLIWEMKMSSFVCLSLSVSHTLFNDAMNADNKTF